MEARPRKSFRLFESSSATSRSQVDRCWRRAVLYRHQLFWPPLFLRFSVVRHFSDGHGEKQSAVVGRWHTDCGEPCLPHPDLLSVREQGRGAMGFQRRSDRPMPVAHGADAHWLW